MIAISWSASKSTFEMSIKRSPNSFSTCVRFFPIPAATRIIFCFSRERTTSLVRIVLLLCPSVTTMSMHVELCHRVNTLHCILQSGFECIVLCLHVSSFTSSCKNHCESYFRGTYFSCFSENQTLQN